MPAIFTILFLLATTLPAEPPAPPVAFVGANVIPMDRETILTDQTVIVRDAKIVAVGPRDDITVPENATRIDAAGRYLLPGLCDMHVHNWFRGEHPLFLANGVTTVRSLWGTPQQKTWRDSPADDVPNYHTAGAIVDGKPPVWPNSHGVASPDEARAAVRFQHENGYDFVKVYSRLGRAEFEAIADEAKKLGIPFGGHVPARIPLAEALASGMHCIEHLTGYDIAAQGDDSPLRKLTPDEIADMPYLRLVGITRQHLDPTHFAELAALTKKHGVWNCPTLIVKKRIVASPATRAQLAQRDEMKYVSPWIRRNWQGDRLAAFPEDERREIEAGFTPSLALTKALHDAGCDLLLGSDTPNPYVFPGFSIHEELALLVQAGLTPYEALRTGTTNPARFLNQTETFGQITQGMRADLLLLNANPLEDIANTRQIHGVMLRGTWFDRGKLDKMLAETAAKWAPKE